jgi:formamidopyrimidine-DNA glycosylase
MIELPEATVLAKEINQTLTGKRIVKAIANQSPHKFAWYTGDPAEYNHRLAGKTIGAAAGCAGNVEIQAGDMTMSLSAPLRYHPKGEKLPAKHHHPDVGRAVLFRKRGKGWLSGLRPGKRAPLAAFR